MSRQRWAKKGVKYIRTPLIETEGVNGVSDMLYSAEESPLGVSCLYLHVMVQDEESLANAKVLIGESFLGYMVEYEVVGVIRAGW